MKSTIQTTQKHVLIEAAYGDAESIALLRNAQSRFQEASQRFMLDPARGKQMLEEATQEVMNAWAAINACDFNRRQLPAIGGIEGV